jgi:RimJ/RimL family protein N-acetyltransferase
VEFDYKPVLKGELLVLRPLLESDFDGLYGVACDPEIWKLHPEKDRYKRAVFERYFADAVKSDTALIALDCVDGKPIGTSRFHGFDAQKSEVEIGWSFLSRACWGGRYNGEMKKLMIDHVYKYVDNILFIIGKENLRSQKAAQKIGAELIDNSFVRGGLENVVYRISRSQ